MSNKITTKAAVCPNCNQFHLICSIEKYKENKDVREDFAEFLVDGFDIIEVSTKEAKERFGFC